MLTITKKRHTHPWLITWSLTKVFSPNKKRQTHSCFARVLKSSVYNLKSKNAKTTKKRHTHSWLLTFGVCP